MTKLGIIRCEAHSESCAGYKCFPAMRERTGSMTLYTDELQLVGFDTCGGCARNSTAKIVDRARRLKERGAEVIHLGNCLVNHCPWTDAFEKAIVEQVGTPVARRTHS